MKQVLIITLAIATMCFRIGHALESTANQDRAVEQELRQLDRAWGEAIMRRDAEALARLLADDYTLTGPSGEVVSKSREIAHIKAPIFDLVLKSFKTEDVDMQVL